MILLATKDTFSPPVLKIGAQAPNFTAALGSGGQFTLSEHRGQNIVLYFYPRAFSPGCKVQTQRFRDAHDKFVKENAIVVGVSTGSPDAVGRFGEACGAPFGLVSDTSGEIRRLYDVERRLGMGTSRVTYVVDVHGVIKGVFHNEILLSSHVRNTLRVLRELR